MRKLASVQYIHQIEPIEGADRIELAHVLGWQCVVPKGTFQVGDLGIYYEIDSFLPMKPEYEFLKSSSYRKNEIMGEGYRIKTMRMRGQLSQGLLLPLSTFPDLPPELREKGSDVTNFLGVRKWEIEERATDFGTIIGTLPSGVPKTDETRVQSMPELIAELDRQPYYITTKMDGSSHSVTINRNGEFHVTGHNYEYADDNKSSFYEFLKKHGIIERLNQYIAEYDYKTLTLQGEFCAPGIQGNPVKLKEPHWYVFTVIADGKRCGLVKMRQICYELNVEAVPLEEIGEYFAEKYTTVDAVLARAEKSTYPTGAKAEGIVVRPIEPCYSPTLGTDLSMKAVSNSYLLKKGKKNA